MKPEPTQDAAADLIVLKAQAYDCLAQIEQWQLKLRQINEQIMQAAKLTTERLT